jgi:hypothetical protein
VSGSALAYAESDDGIKWRKPALGILSFNGSKENNLVSPYQSGGSVFYDEHGLEAERFKTLHFGKLPEEPAASGGTSDAKYGLYGLSSPDGHHWTKHPKPLVRYFADTVNVAGWDPLLKRYVGFFRHHFSGRTISRAETEDFWNWPTPEPLLYAGPLDSPADDYYTSCYTCYPGQPSLRLLFPAIYHHDTDAVDVRLGSSRDGRVFQLNSYTPILRAGGSGESDGSLYANPNLIQLPDGRLALPCDAYSTTHNEAFYKNFYGDYGTPAAVTWALWKDGRLAGIQAEEHGEFTMNATPFSGSDIEINARTGRAGSAELELRERGKPVPGFSFADAVPFGGDSVWEKYRWKNGATPAKLKGKYLELSFRLRSAKIFACRFV